MAKSLKDIVSKYKIHDTFILFNEEDDVLHTIKIKLPDPPELKTIDGYGLVNRQQFFKVPEYPIRLKELEDSCESIDEVWTKLTHYQDNYSQEIAFIKREWDRRIHGYWCYINGKPTYIDGWHYLFLSYWRIDIGLPDYRSRDRKFYHFVRYAYTTTEAYYIYRAIDRDTKTVLSFFHSERDLLRFLKDKDPDLVAAQKGDFYLDLKRRICYGINYPKHRREGATYRADEILLAVLSLLENSHGGIQSMDGDSAGKAFSKAVVKPWRKLPFFFSPSYAGSTDPKTKLEFDMPSKKIGGKGSIVNIATGLESEITWANSANRSWYDGDKLKVLHNDEVGKTLLEDVNARWDVQKKCLAQGNGVFIHGLAINTSTVGEMSEAGGKAFYRLCSHSHYEKRNKIGQTQSGLFNMFIPAHDGLEGFIDMFGESIIEDPNENEKHNWALPIRDSNSKLIGAKRYLNEVIEEILLREDEESIKEYEEEVRLHPTSFSQCFITAGSGSGLNMKKIVKRMKELMFDKTITKRGNFQWENGEPDTRVIWHDDPVNGRWIISMQLSDNESNQRISEIIQDVDGKDKKVFRPLKPYIFTAGADPFLFRKTEGKRLSNGGGSVFMERDETVDPPGKPIHEWKTYRTVCTYSNRPFDPDSYAEDMLMMCVYYGAMMFPEINIPLVWNYFVRRDYDGYLKYSRDLSGVWKKTPGFYNKGAFPQKIMQLHQDYIENFVDLERHIEVLEQAKSIKGVEALTDYDLFVAVGASYIGAETSYASLFEGILQDDTSDISDFFN